MGDSLSFELGWQPHLSAGCAASQYISGTHSTWARKAIEALDWAVGPDELAPALQAGGAGEEEVEADRRRRARRRRSLLKKGKKKKSKKKGDEGKAQEKEQKPPPAEKASDPPSDAQRSSALRAPRPRASLVVLNMCAFWGRSGQPRLLEQQERIFLHGQRLMQAAEAARQPLRLVWKSCTVKSDFQAVAAPLVDDLARGHGWEVFDVREVSDAAMRQDLMITWNPSTVHFLQLAYETFNDLLLTILCP